MPALTKQYIHDHQHAVHTSDSFGRAITERILSVAAEEAGDAGVPNVTVPVEFKVAPYEALACVQVCATIQGVTICGHVG